VQPTRSFCPTAGPWGAEPDGIPMVSNFPRRPKRSALAATAKKFHSLRNVSFFISENSQK